jgi:hypothetical protein
MSDTNNPTSTNPILDAIKAKGTRPPESHAIESLGGLTLFFRHLTGAEADRMQVQTLDNEGKFVVSKLEGYRAAMISLCLCDSEGRKVATPADVQSWDNDVINELHKICKKINKIGKEEVAAEEKG